MRKIILILSVISFTLLSCGSQQQEGISVLEPNVYEQKLNEKEVQLIDVRTPQEYAEGHIANAKNINVKSSDFETQIETLDKEKPVMVYCLGGVRSANAANVLKQKGFKNIIDLQGGISNWQNAGKPVSNQ